MGTTILGSNELMQAGEASISCYIDEIPPFVEAELVKAYDTLHSSLPFFKVFRSLDHVSCYVARRDGHPATVLLFTCRNGRVDVLNEMIEIEQSELDRFVRYIFTKFERVDVISFKALKTATENFCFPVQKHNSKDTYVVALPGTPEEYTASIGKNTRADIRQQTNRIRRDFPSFAWRFFVNEDIDEKHVREIVKFSENKINAKGVKVSHDVERIMALAKMCGFVSVLLIDGRVCAGSINYLVGTSCFGDVTGYDPQYEKYGFGKLCLHETISETIMRGGTKFYLGGGVFDFKQRMLGTLLCMDELHIYRSYAKMLVHFDRTAGAAIAACVGRLKKMLHRHKKKAWAKFVFSSFHLLKNKLAK
jgi:hypothetical protein